MYDSLVTDIFYTLFLKLPERIKSKRNIKFVGNSIAKNGELKY